MKRKIVIRIFIRLIKLFKLLEVILSKFLNEQLFENTLYLSFIEPIEFPISKRLQMCGYTNGIFVLPIVILI